MAPTARGYGLRVDRWLDERLDPEKSTVAAARTTCATSTPSSGRGSWRRRPITRARWTVQRAIRGAGTRDFWTLSRSRWLRAETKDFVPANPRRGRSLGRSPSGYGFAVTPEPPLHYEQIAVPKATTLRRIAALAGIP